LLLAPLVLLALLALVLPVSSLPFLHFLHWPLPFRWRSGGLARALWPELSGSPSLWVSDSSSLVWLAGSLELAGRLALGWRCPPLTRVVVLSSCCPRSFSRPDFLTRSLSTDFAGSLVLSGHVAVWLALSGLNSGSGSGCLVPSRVGPGSTWLTGSSDLLARESSLVWVVWVV
jgi:hypothetical protein